jgi:hypothetical protein
VKGENNERKPRIGLAAHREKKPQPTGSKKQRWRGMRRQEVEKEEARRFIKKLLEVPQQKSAGSQRDPPESWPLENDTRILIPLKIGRKVLIVLYDTGAAVSVMDERAFRDLGLPSVATDEVLKGVADDREIAVRKKVVASVAAPNWSSSSSQEKLGWH